MPGQQIPRLLGVVGAGQMGAGIAQVAASKGVPVVLVDVAQRSLDQGLATIQRSLAKQIQKQHSTQEEADKTSAYIRTSLSLKVAVKLHLQPVGTHHQLLPSQELEQADFIIEAVSESERLKKSIFEQLGKVHLAANNFAQHLGKLVCNSQDRPGFIVNRVLMPMVNEAFYALMEGVGTAQDIDNGMKLGTNQPMGPLQLADFIGLDTCLAIMRVLHEGLGDSKYRPCPLLVQYVDAGWLGKKAHKGVYSYAKQL
ncbi:hypothetical protein ABBQ38_002558 [Trebouxia sp. C0009 RCD-2024]